jgi:hypothetical protein
MFDDSFDRRIICGWNVFLHIASPIMRVPSGSWLELKVA